MSIPSPSTGASGSPAFASRSGAVRMVKRLGSSCAVTSDQLQRPRDGRPGQRPHRERRDDRLTPAVLAEVDVHLAVARADHAGDRRDRRQRLDGQRGEQAGERPRLLVRVARAQRQQDVQARRPRRLRVARQLQLLEDAPERQRDLDDVGERRPLGVEVEHQPVGPVERLQPRGPQVQRDRAGVGDVAQRLDVVHDEVVDVALDALGPDALGVHPRGHPRRRVLLEEGLALDPVGVPRQHDRPRAQIRQQPRRHALVVADEIRLRVPLVRPEHLRRIRDDHSPIDGLVGVRR